MIWIKCSERLPDKPGLIEVLIGKTRFMGEAFFEDGNHRFRPNDYVLFSIEHPELNSNIVYNNITPGIGKGWIMEDYLKEPTYWTYVDDLPT